MVGGGRFDPVRIRRPAAASVSDCKDAGETPGAPFGSTEFAGDLGLGRGLDEGKVAQIQALVRGTIPPMSRGRRTSITDHLHPITRSWFNSRFEAPTDAQRLGWETIVRGDHALVAAPTGSWNGGSVFRPPSAR